MIGGKMKAESDAAAKKILNRAKEVCCHER